MVQLFVFSAGGLRCAIPLAGIQSVIQMMEVMPSAVPGAGRVGNLNLHGKVIPVFSMMRLLGAAEPAPRLSDMLVIARAGDETVALWINETRGVEELDLPQPLSPGHGSLAGPQGTSLTGTGTIVITDLPAFLARGPGAPVSGVPMALREAAAPGIPPQEDQGLDPVQVRAILAERAVRMLPPEPGTTIANMAEILRFQLAYQDYAIEMNFVREVILTGEITPVPGTPDFISGICASRGAIISLVDLRALFRIPEKGLTDLNRVIVMTDGQITFGILADTISGVGTIAMDTVVPLRKDEFPGGERYLKGVLARNTYLLDAAAILGDPGIIVDDA